MTPAELLAAHPYVPGSNAWDFPFGPERLRSIEDPELRMAAAGFYVAAQERWEREDGARRARVGKARLRGSQAQSRENVEHWNGGDR